MKNTLIGISEISLFVFAIFTLTFYFFKIISKVNYENSQMMLIKISETGSCLICKDSLDKDACSECEIDSIYR